MNQTLNGIRRILITILVAMGVGALFIVAIGENPIDAYAALFRGAFEAACLGRQHKGFILRRHENLPFLLRFPTLRVKSTGYKKLFTYYKIL